MNAPAARGSDRLHQYLLQHPRFGPMIRDWQAHGAVSRRAKIAATLTMLVCAAVLMLVMLSVASHRWWMAVLPIACITRGRRGAELADLVELARAGAVAFSADGSPVSDGRLFRSALEYAQSADRLIIEHAQDLALSGKGVMHEGAVSAQLGSPYLLPLRCKA